jgi:putative tryptophan/tyrosine transport system substrate-binding protein
LGTGVATTAVQQLTQTIPIVLGNSTDPVALGYVASLAHPGGNVTGLATSSQDTTSKQLEWIAIAAPNTTRVGFLANPNNPTHLFLLNPLRAAAKHAGIDIVVVDLPSPEELSSAFVKLGNERVSALLVPTDAFFFSQRQRIADFAVKARLPTIFSQREYVEAGGLMSYGENLSDFYRRAASYVDKIFKGAKPADLPVEQPTRFFLVFNRKTAEAIGITMPLQLLVAADEVIG